MDDRAMEFRVGLVVMATLIVGGILVYFLGEFGVKKQYTLYVRFKSAPGVTVDTPVRKSGILIGRVTNVELVDGGGVLVTARVDGDRKIQRNEVCKITTGTILGDAELEFVGGERPATSATDVFVDGDYIDDGVVGQNPLNALGSFMDVLTGMEGEIKDALTSIKGAGEDVGRAADSLNTLISGNQDRISSLLIKAETSMDRFDFAMSSIEEFVRDDELKQKVTQALDQVPALLTDARDMMTTLKSAASRLDRNLENVEGLTEPLGQAGQQLFSRGEAIIGKLDTSLEQFDALTTELVTFSRSLNDEDSTIGQLTHNRELYDRINRTAANIEEASAQLRPILSDARVFTDKIARNPGRVGLQGALQRQQSGLKY